MHTIVNWYTIVSNKLWVHLQVIHQEMFQSTPEPKLGTSGTTHDPTESTRQSYVKTEALALFLASVERLKIIMLIENIGG